ncbi:transketolase C-terminal domain-containing protein, partial [Chloroflexota bacterium]
MPPPDTYFEAKKAQDEILKDSKKTIIRCWEDFGHSFQRNYHPVEFHRSEGAKILLLTMGSFSETASLAINEMRDEGKEVGLIRLRLWRPFPFEELRQAVKDADVLIVLDRAYSFGGPAGPVCSEVKAALYGKPNAPKVVSIIGGLGGR